MRGGQVFLGPQIDALGPDTQLVTLTIGGNDIDYVGDLTFMAFRNRGGFTGALAGLVWSGAKPVQDRKFGKLQRDLIATLREITAPCAKGPCFRCALSYYLAEKWHVPAAWYRRATSHFDAIRRAAFSRSNAFPPHKKQGRALLIWLTLQRAMMLALRNLGSMAQHLQTVRRSIRRWRAAKGVAAQIMTTLKEELRK